MTYPFATSFEQFQQMIKCFQNHIPLYWNEIDFAEKITFLCQIYWNVFLSWAGYAMNDSRQNITLLIWNSICYWGLIITRMSNASFPAEWFFRFVASWYLFTRSRAAKNITDGFSFFACLQLTKYALSLAKYALSIKFKKMFTRSRSLCSKYLMKCLVFFQM